MYLIIELLGFELEQYRQAYAPLVSMLFGHVIDCSCDAEDFIIMFSKSSYVI
jgi:hypothetical protein